MEGRTGGCGNLQGGVSSCLAGWVGPGSLWSPRGLPPCLKERPESDPRVGFATPGCPRLAGEETGQANPLARSRQEACGRARSPTNHGSSAAGLLCPSVTHRKGCRRPGGTKEERDEATWHHRGSGGGHWGGGGVGVPHPLSSSASHPGPGLNPALAPLLRGSPNGGGELKSPEKLPGDTELDFFRTLIRTLGGTGRPGSAYRVCRGHREP